jgi:hypothetical protein
MTYPKGYVPIKNKLKESDPVRVGTNDDISSVENLNRKGKHRSWISTLAKVGAALLIDYGESKYSGIAVGAEELTYKDRVGFKIGNIGNQDIINNI